MTTDRHANASDLEKKEQEKKFKEVGEAYAVLLDTKKRARYDNGQDMDDEDGFGGKLQRGRSLKVLVKLTDQDKHRCSVLVYSLHFLDYYMHKKNNNNLTSLEAIQI